MNSSYLLQWFLSVQFLVIIIPSSYNFDAINFNKHTSDEIIAIIT